MNCGRAAAFVIAIDALALGTSTTPGLAHVTVSPATLSAGAEDTMRKLPVPISTDDGEVAAAVATITWSGGRIAPGEYQDFAILAGPIPSGAKTLPFKAVRRTRTARSSAGSNVAGRANPSRRTRHQSSTCADLNASGGRQTHPLRRQLLAAAPLSRKP